MTALRCDSWNWNVIVITELCGRCCKYSTVPEVFNGDDENVC